MISIIYVSISLTHEYEHWISVLVSIIISRHIAKITNKKDTKKIWNSNNSFYPERCPSMSIPGPCGSGPGSSRPWRPLPSLLNNSVCLFSLTTSQVAAFFGCIDHPILSGLLFAVLSPPLMSSWGLLVLVELVSVLQSNLSSDENSGKGRKTCE